MMDTEKKEHELKKAQRKADFIKVLDTKEGRRIFWFLIKDICGFMQSPADVSNVYNTYFESGKRKVGEALVKKIDEIEPMFMFKMARENAKKK